MDQTLREAALPAGMEGRFIPMKSDHRGRA
jgi:hypothetical protein